MTQVSRKPAMEEEKSGDFVITADIGYVRISADKDWLRIVTDDWEGNASMMIETLPLVRKALALIAKRMKEKKDAAR